MVKYSYDSLVYFGKDVQKSISRMTQFGYDAIDLAEAIDVATQYRALRGPTSSADAALQTAGAAAYGQTRRPKAGPHRSKPKAKIPRGRGKSHPIPSITHQRIPRITCLFFRGKYKESHFLMPEKESSKNKSLGGVDVLNDPRCNRGCPVRSVSNESYEIKFI